MSNAKFRHTLFSCVRVSKMQGAEMEDEGSVLKYMTKSKIEEQRSSLLIMTQRLFVFPTDNRFPNQSSDTQRSNAQKVRTLASSVLPPSEQQGKGHFLHSAILNPCSTNPACRAQFGNQMALCAAHRRIWNQDASLHVCEAKF